MIFNALRNCSTRPRRFAVSVKERSLDRRAISGGRCPLFYYDIHEAEVTDHYMALIYDAVRLAGGELLPYDKSISVRKEDFILTNEFPITFYHMLRGHRNHMLWIQGIIPEESRLRGHSWLRFKLLSMIEKRVIKRAKLLFLVSEEMQRHYEKKYRLPLSEKSVIFPCFSEKTIHENAFFDEKYQKNTFAYVGSLSAWQCFSETVALYRKIEENSESPTKFYVFTQETEKASAYLQKMGIQRFEVAYHQGETLSKALAGIKYGFVLREDIPVNRVATPTKFSSYLSCGVIPVFSSALRDFHAVHAKNPLGIEDPTAEYLLSDMKKTRLANTMKNVCKGYFDTYYNVENGKKCFAEAIRKTAKLSEKPTLLITIGNLKTGGIAKALTVFLREMMPYYEISLLAMREGEISAEIPEGVHRIAPNDFMKITELSRGELHGISLGARLFRYLGAIWSKIFGKRLPFRLISGKHGTFDAVISFCQPSGAKSFCNLANESALWGAKSTKKVTFLHADFTKYGGNDAYNRSLYRKFDAVCAVSDAVGEQLLSVMPDLKNKIFTIRNFLDTADILQKSEAVISPLSGEIKILTVCRLEAEKGLLRCIPMMKACEKQGASFVWHIVGDGAEREKLEKAVMENGLSERIIFHGAVENPYPYMKQADFFFLPSFHEAAPLVLEEAKLLGLPILTTETLSARALVGDLGIVCQNDDTVLEVALLDFLKEKRYETIRKQYDKDAVLREFEERRKQTLQMLLDILA